VTGWPDNLSDSDWVIDRLLGGWFRLTGLATGVAELSMLCFGALLALSQLKAPFMLYLFHEPLDHVSVHLESVDHAFCESSFLFF